MNEKFTDIESVVKFKDCGPGYFRPNDTKFNWLCITFPKQADTWYNAEQTCLQNPRTGHILTFSSRQQSEALLTQ